MLKAFSTTIILLGNELLRLCRFLQWNLRDEVLKLGQARNKILGPFAHILKIRHLRPKLFLATEQTIWHHFLIVPSSK